MRFLVVFRGLLQLILSLSLNHARAATTTSTVTAATIEPTRYITWSPVTSWGTPTPYPTADGLYWIGASWSRSPTPPFSQPQITRTLLAIGTSTYEDGTTSSYSQTTLYTFLRYPVQPKHIPAASKWPPVNWAVCAAKNPPKPVGYTTDRRCDAMRPYGGNTTCNGQCMLVDGEFECPYFGPAETEENKWIPSVGRACWAFPLYPSTYIFLGEPCHVGDPLTYYFRDDC